MAFMVPVMKNNFDIYKTGNNKNRRISECSSQSSSSCRSRKLSERSQSESGSLSTSPSTQNATAFMAGSPTSMSAFAQRMQSRGFSRTSSRNSQSSLMSPTRNACSGSSPPKSGNTTSGGAGGGSEGSLNKFHTRLVDKLKRSLRRDNSRDGNSAHSRSWEGDADEVVDIQERLALGIANGLSLSSGDEEEEDDPEKEDDGAEGQSVDKVLHRRRSGIEFSSLRSPPAETSWPRKLPDSLYGGVVGSDSALIIREKPPLPHKSTKPQMASTGEEKKKKRKHRLLLFRSN